MYSTNLTLTDTPTQHLTSHISTHALGEGKGSRFLSLAGSINPD